MWRSLTQVLVLLVLKKLQQMNLDKETLLIETFSMENVKWEENEHRTRISAKVLPEKFLEVCEWRRKFRQLEKKTEKLQVENFEEKLFLAVATISRKFKEAWAWSNGKRFKNDLNGKELEII